MLQFHSIASTSKVHDPHSLVIMRERELLDKFDSQNIEAGIDTVRAKKKMLKNLLHRVEGSTSLRVYES